MPFQRRGKCIFHWRGRAWLTIWDRVKIPRYSHRLMHRKRVTCELHDSYFRSMTNKHAIPKMAKVHIPMVSYGQILSGRELLYKFNQSLEIREFWRQDVVEKASIQQRAGPPGLRLSNPGERKRNADGHKSGEVSMLQFCSVSNSPSHTNLSNKVRGIFFLELCRPLLARAKYNRERFYQSKVFGQPQKFLFSS